MSIKKPVIKITKAGWIYITLSIFLGFAAINTGNNLIFIIDSALLGFMGISGFFGKKNIENLKVDIIFPNELFANKVFPLKVVLYNKKKIMPSFLIKIKIRDSNYIFFPFIDKNSQESAYIDFYFEKRGYNYIDFIVISSIFPFSFFIRYKYPKIKAKKIVYPYPLKCNIEIIQNIIEKVDGTNYRDKNGNSNEIYLFRSYQKNDPVKLINWKLSAKINDLILNLFGDEQNPPIKIDFEKVDIKNIEVKISKITYLILLLTTNQKSVELILNNEIYRDKIEIFKQLALYK